MVLYQQNELSTSPSSMTPVALFLWCEQDVENWASRGDGSLRTKVATMAMLDGALAVPRLVLVAQDAMHDDVSHCREAEKEAVLLTGHSSSAEVVQLERITTVAPRLASPVVLKSPGPLGPSLASHRFCQGHFKGNCETKGSCAGLYSSCCSFVKIRLAWNMQRCFDGFHTMTYCIRSTILRM